MPKVNYPKTFSVAPMMAWTNRHCRMFHRQISQYALLYTEMVTAGAIIYGDHKRFLSYHPKEHNIALQIGGGDPKSLSKAVEIANQYQYDEINLNVGCPSDRVQKGKIGAVLMAEPQLVASCFHAMQQSTDTKVTIKNRLSIDDMKEDTVFQFIETVANAGCQTFIIHARKAFLKGLDPKQNRDVPPLRYDLVYAVKEQFPELEIIINGGIKTISEAKEHLLHVDGVMVGREAYQNPWILSQVDNLLSSTENNQTRKEVIRALIPYIQSELKQGTSLKHITRHWMGLFYGQSGTGAFKRFLNDHANQNNIAIIEQALNQIPDNI